MMQWVPYGAPEEEFKAHIRTFAAVFPKVTSGPRRRRVRRSTCSARTSPSSSSPRSPREVLARPGVLEDISSAYDSPADDRRAAGSTSSIARPGSTDDAARAYVGDGPLITDDRPRPEYFLLRRWLGIG